MAHDACARKQVDCDIDTDHAGGSTAEGMRWQHHACRRHVMQGLLPGRPDLGLGLVFYHRVGASCPASRRETRTLVPISLIFDQSARTGQATKPHWQNLRRPASREKPGKLFSRRDSGFHHAECGQARARYWRFNSGPRDHGGITSQYLASFMHDLNSFHTLRISKWQSGVKPLFGAPAPGTCAAGSHGSEQASIPSQAWLGAPAYPGDARYASEVAATTLDWTSFVHG
jgi:hypothetical protein